MKFPRTVWIIFDSAGEIIGATSTREDAAAAIENHPGHDAAHYFNVDSFNTFMASGFEAAENMASGFNAAENVADAAANGDREDLVAENEDIKRARRRSHAPAPKVTKIPPC